MRIFIAGGLGFVGGRLAEYLSINGHSVILGSRNISEAPAWLPNAEFKTMDWESESSLMQCCQNVDVVIHAAGMNANDCSEDPVSAFSFNGKSTGRLVNAALNSGVCKFIYFSTAHVYSNPLEGLISEETVPKNNHPYATSHLAGENEVLDLKESKKMWCIVLRLSNAFGIPKDPNMNCWMLLINDLCRQAVQKNQLVLRTNSMQVRDFISLTQVCHVVANLINKDRKNNLNVFNLGSGNSKSLNEITKLVQQRCIKVLNFKPEILYEVNPDVRHKPPLLKYKNNNLPLLGISVDDIFNLEEIDNLLGYCQNKFVIQI